MQIQRVQSLYLLLAFVLLTVFIFIPFGYSLLTVDGADRVVEAWYPYQSLGLVLPVAAAAVLSLAAIFLYNNVTAQKGLIWVSVALTVATAGVTIYFLVAGFMVLSDVEAALTHRWGGGGLLLLAAVISQAMAVSRINADQRLLRDYDRLR